MGERESQQACVKGCFLLCRWGPHSTGNLLRNKACCASEKTLCGTGTLGCLSRTPPSLWLRVAFGSISKLPCTRLSIFCKAGESSQAKMQKDPGSFQVQRNCPPWLWMDSKLHSSGWIRKWAQLYQKCSSLTSERASPLTAGICSNVPSQ